MCLIVCVCVSWNVCVHRRCLFLCAFMCPCANESVCPYVGVCVLLCYSVPLCVPMCVVCSLLVEFNPCVQGVTSPLHTRFHSYCSTLTFYSPPTTNQPTPPYRLHICPERAIKETNVFPKISWLPALHTNAMPSGYK